mgnify:CR=1 FL=1
MAKQINGETWYYVDTVCDEELIYDIYQNEQGETFYDVVGTLY